MRYFILSCELNDSNTDRIQELFNVVSDSDRELVVYLDSNGGYVSWAHSIINVLNNHRQYITVIGGPDLCSSGLLIWLGYKGYKDVSIGVRAIAHMASVGSTLRDGKALQVSDPREDSLVIGRFATQLVSKLLTSKQMDAYKSGLDVLIPYSQLRKHAIAHNKSL